LGEPAYAGLFEKAGLGRSSIKDATFEVDKELLAGANCTKGIQFFKDLRARLKAKETELEANPTTMPLRKFLEDEFRIFEIRQNLNYVTPAFDEKTQTTMGFIMNAVMDQNAKIEKDARFKKGKDRRGGKAAERVLGAFEEAVLELDAFLAFFP
jgi:hypothetical protein